MLGEQRTTIRCPASLSLAGSWCNRDIDKWEITSPITGKCYVRCRVSQLTIGSCHIRRLLDEIRDFTNYVQNPPCTNVESVRIRVLKSSAEADHFIEFLGLCFRL